MHKFGNKNDVGTYLAGKYYEYYTIFIGVIYITLSLSFVANFYNF